jgi:hypothetical protein
VLFFDGLLGVVALGVWIFCIIDVITTPDSGVRNLPKLAWLFIVIVLVDVGSIAWLIAGRDWNKQPAPTLSRPTARPRRASTPDDDDEFLASLRARAEEQRRRAREADQKDETQGGADPVG